MSKPTKKKVPKDYIIFPLDVPDRASALTYVNRLKDHVGLFKVGLELFISEGPSILAAIREITPAGIFLDLKLHDIPETMRRAFTAASAHRPELVTVHCDEGGGFLKPIAGSDPGDTQILAVTLLTSLNQAKLKALGYAGTYVEDLSALVLLRARIAMEAGCDGVVCSGHEVARIKAELGKDLIAVTPGIRPAWSLVQKDDQKRIVTPADAVKAGADYIVVGRPIRDAADPAGAAEKVADEIASAL
jgi:orotidine-5'-phosphate decarboxylase